MAAATLAPAFRTVEEFLNAPPPGKVEFVDGDLFEIMPTNLEHFYVWSFLHRLMADFAEETEAGVVLGETVALRTEDGRARVPDFSFFRTEHRHRVQATFAESPADVVVEIVSPESLARDRGEKFLEYEAAGTGEYWLLDPERRRAEFHRLEDGRFREVRPVDGWFVSHAFPGFRLREEWLWDRPKVAAALAEILREAK